MFCMPKEINIFMAKNEKTLKSVASKASKLLSSKTASKTKIRKKI